MRPHLEAFVGVGWDQLLALMTVVASMTGGAMGVVLFFLRFRLGKYFVTRPDHFAFREKLGEEHEQNTKRLLALEEKTEKLATKHSLANIIQRQDSLSQQISSLATSHATLEGKINGVAEGNNRVEHMMGLVLETMLQRDKP